MDEPHTATASHPKRLASVYLWLLLGLWGLGLPVWIFYATGRQLDQVYNALSAQLDPIARKVAEETATRVATETAARVAQQVRADVAQDLAERTRAEIHTTLEEYGLQQPGFFTSREPDAPLPDRALWLSGEAFPQFALATAPDIVVGTPQKASVPPDSFAPLRLHVTRPTMYQIDVVGHVDSDDSLFDPYLYLYLTTNSLALVAADDDGGNADTRWAARLLETLEPGTYYIVVEGFAGDGGDCTVSVEALNPAS